MKCYPDFHEILLPVALALEVLSPIGSPSQEVSSASTQVWKAPARAERMRNPVQPDQRSIAQAKQFYINECIVCHGPTGKGDGSKARELRTHPGDLSGPKMPQQTDGELFWKITFGRTPMPAYRTKFSEKQRWMMVNYLRTLATEGSKTTTGGVAQVTKERRVIAEATTPAEPKEAPKPQVGAEPQPGDRTYVSREEYQRLRNDYDRLKAEIDSIKAQIQTSPKTVPPGQTETQPDTRKLADELEKEMEELNERVQQTSPGSLKFVLTGSGFGGFTAKQHGDSTFSAGFAPVFLWKISDRILFESEFHINLKDSDTDFDLETAQVSYLMNDYMTLGAGKFLSPMNLFQERYHAAWINPLPDRPLAVGEGLLPETQIGIQVRGGIPVEPIKLGYAFYVANAPELNTDDPSEAGTLEFDNFNNRNGHVAVGGRVGFFPIAELEVGYGFQISGVGRGDVDAFLQSVDLNYVRDSELLKGIVALSAQWAWSQVDRRTYDPDGSQGFGPITFDNDRNGGYALAAYRLSRVENDWLKKFEPVVRFDLLNQPDTPVGFDEQRWTIGLNYWLGPATVAKAAYQFDERTGTRKAQDAVLLQLAIGF